MNNTNTPSPQVPKGTTSSIDTLLKAAKVEEDDFVAFKAFLEWAGVVEDTLDQVTREKLKEWVKEYRELEDPKFTLGVYAGNIAEAATNWGKTATTQVVQPAPGKRKIDDEHGLETVKRIRQMGLSGVTVNTFINLPRDHFIQHTGRTRSSTILFSTNDAVIPLMHRKVTQDMLEFILHRGNFVAQSTAFPVTPAVYIHGLRGVGKSYSLYEVVCLLREKPNNRVIYVPDCGGWLGYGDPVGFLLDVISRAFVEDPEVIKQCLLSLKEDHDIIHLLRDFLPAYCVKHELYLYAIFDQHDALSMENRKLFPYNLLEENIPTWSSWKQNALLVLSESANNEYYLKVAYNNKWPTFIMNRGFDDDEFNAWAKENQFFPNDPELLAETCYWTGYIPYDLDMMRRIQVSNPHFTLDQVNSQYLDERTAEFTAQSLKFSEEYIKGDETNMKLFLEAVSFMIIGLPIPPGQSMLLNEQMMYISERRIYPINPLAEQHLKNHYGPIL